MLAGLGLGVLEAVSAGLISSDYRQAIVYGTLIVYLLARDFYGEEGAISRRLKARRASAAGSVDEPELRAQIGERVHAVEDYQRTKSVGHASVAGGPLARLRTLSGRRPTFMMALPVIVLGLAAFYPTTTDDIGQLDAAVFILLAAMAATGLGLVMGLAGQFSLGQAVFVLVSAYASAILTADHGWNPMAALVVGVGLSVVLGLRCRVADAAVGGAQPGARDPGDPRHRVGVRRAAGQPDPRQPGCSGRRAVRDLRRDDPGAQVLLPAVPRSSSR